MPLALTLNETLSNCFEHAFPGGRQGLVKASLTFTDKQGKLVVTDNGVGIPDDLRPGSGSGLGLKILTVFAEQMRGQLILGSSDSGGTEISLRFPIAYADI
jgi:two-component sensor histidine kinase